jgi:hypothetical protein
VSGPRFRPSAVFANSRDFGRNRSAETVATPHLSPGERAWALFQHDVACNVLFALRGPFSPVTELAQLLDVNRDWLVRKAYGRVPADLGELLDWLAVTGAKIPELRGIVLDSKATRAVTE